MIHLDLLNVASYASSSMTTSTTVQVSCVSGKAEPLILHPARAHEMDVKGLETMQAILIGSKHSLVS